MGWRDRRAADIELRRSAWRVARDRKSPRRVRRAALKIYLAFAFRTAIGWHAPPRGRLDELVGEFRYGNYCGVGHGLPTGEERKPIDRLDAACQDHDAAYMK